VPQAPLVQDIFIVLPRLPAIHDVLSSGLDPFYETRMNMTETHRFKRRTREDERAAAATGPFLLW